MRALFLVLFLFVLPVAAQEPCAVPLRIAPDIRGFRLSMAYEEARGIFPDSFAFRIAPKIDEVGVIDNVDLTVLDWYNEREKFKGLEHLILVFTDGRISQMGAVYDTTVRWPNIEAFTMQLSKQLAMPDAWSLPKNADPKNVRVMHCEGFRIIASINTAGHSFIGLVDNTLEKAVKDRRAAIEEKKRQSFKP
jgi:hypothetical protein